MMPQLGETVTEGTITRWMKGVGDPVERDEPLFEVSTDKVDSEVPSPAAGVLTEILVPEGETVEVGVRLAVIGDGSGEAAAPAAPRRRAGACRPECAAGPEQGACSERAAPAPPRAERAALHRPHLRRRPRRPRRLPRPPHLRPTGRSRPCSRPSCAGSCPRTASTSPRSRRPEPVGGSPARTCCASSTPAGPRHRPPRPHHHHPPPAAPPPPPPAPASTSAAVMSPPTAAPSVSVAAYRGAGDQVVPFSNMRRRTAEHMVRSKATSPHAFIAKEVDFESVERVRKAWGERFKAEEGFGLTYLPFVARATVEALRDFPLLNASVVDDSLVVHGEVNLGIAVDLSHEGLIVPVIHRAEEVTLRGVARRIRDLAERARDRKLNADDIAGWHLLHHQRRPVRHVLHRADHQPAPGGHPGHRRHRPPPGGGHPCRRDRVDRHPLHRRARRAAGTTAPSTGPTCRCSWPGCPIFSPAATGRPSSEDGTGAAHPVARDGPLPRGLRPPARPGHARRATTTCSSSSTPTPTRSARTPTTVTCSSTPPRSAPCWSGPTAVATSPTTVRASWWPTRSSPCPTTRPRARPTCTASNRW